MKILIPFLFALLFFSAAFGQQTSEELQAKVRTFKNTNHRNYKINYDKATDKTSVVYIGDVVSNSLFVPGYVIQMFAAFEYKTNTLTENINEFSLMFSAVGRKSEFTDSSSLSASADGERFEFESKSYDAEQKSTFLGLFSSQELLIFRLSRKELQKLAKAKTVEIKVGKREFKLKDSSKRGFNNILALSLKTP